MEPVFDADAFFRAVEAKRASERLSWREVGRRLGLNASTFSRLSRGRRPDVETFLKLLGWLGVPATNFVSDSRDIESDGVDARTTVTLALRRDPAIGRRDAASLEEIFRVAYTQFAGGRRPPEGVEDQTDSRRPRGTREGARDVQRPVGRRLPGQTRRSR